MKKVTLWQLLSIMTRLPPRQADLYLPYINDAMHRWGIESTEQKAAFIACLAHPSRQLRKWRSEKSGWEREGREEIGNVFPGDGPKYKEGGPLPIVGRTMYYAAARGTGFLDLSTKPGIITHPEVGLMVAGWLWSKHLKLNAVVSDGNEDTLKWAWYKLTGGNKGFRAVSIYWNRAKRALEGA